MTSKKVGDKKTDASEAPPPERVLTSKQEVIDELKMGMTMFNSLLKKYPFCSCGAPGKLSGRWHVAVEDVWRWYRHIQKQELRHPDSRRLRPEEPPGIAAIKGR